MGCFQRGKLCDKARVIFPQPSQPRQQLLAVLMQRAILPGQLVGRILHQFPAALVKILALLYQLLTRVDQVIRDFFSLAD